MRNAGLLEIYPNDATAVVYFVLDNDAATASTSSARLNYYNPLHLSPVQVGTAAGAAVSALYMTSAQRITGLEYAI